MTIDCIIFDLDGVIIDSFMAWLETCRDVFKKFGLKIPSEKELREIRGITMVELINKFRPNGVELCEEMVKQIVSSMIEAQEEKIVSPLVKVQKGGYKLLETLRQGNKKNGYSNS